MSTAALPGAIGPVLVPRSSRTLPSSLVIADAPPATIDLTIHRITKTHHGRTLLTLGHAAEHLANSRRFRIEGMGESDAEAIHILLGLSRSVFDEYAERVPVTRRVEQWLAERVVQLLC